MTSERNDENFSQLLVKAQTGVGFKLDKGQELRVAASLGQQVSDLFCFSRERPHDALSSGRSIDYNETIYLTKGHILYANSGQALLEIVEDTCGQHDFLVTPCSQQMFQMISGSSAHHPSCHENLCTAFAAFDRPAELVTTTFNIFMNYRADQAGRIHLRTPTNTSSDFIVFRALADLVIGLTACSDPATNGGHCKDIQYAILDSPKKTAENQSDF